MTLMLTSAVQIVILQEISKLSSHASTMLGRYMTPRDNVVNFCRFTRISKYESLDTNDRSYLKGNAHKKLINFIFVK